MSFKSVKPSEQGTLTYSICQKHNLGLAFFYKAGSLTYHTLKILFFNFKIYSEVVCVCVCVCVLRFENACDFPQEFRITEGKTRQRRPSPLQKNVETEGKDIWEIQ